MYIVLVPAEVCASLMAPINELRTYAAGGVCLLLYGFFYELTGLKSTPVAPEEGLKNASPAPAEEGLKNTTTSS